MFLKLFSVGATIKTVIAKIDSQGVCIWVVTVISDTNFNLSKSIGTAITSVGQLNFLYLLWTAQVNSPPWVTVPVCVGT